MLNKGLSIEGGRELADIDVDKVRRQGQPLQRSPPFARSEDAPIGVLVGDFRSQVAVARNMLLNLRLCSARASIRNSRECLGNSAEQLEQCRSMERFDIGPAQRQRLIDRLPTNVHFWPLGIAEIAIPLFALGKADLH